MSRIIEGSVYNIKYNTNEQREPIGFVEIAAENAYQAIRGACLKAKISEEHIISLEKLPEPITIYVEEPKTPGIQFGVVNGGLTTGLR